MQHGRRARAGATGSQSALGRVHDDKRVHLVRGDRTLFDVHGRSAEQRIAIDLLADPSVGIVSIGGRAGTGKSVMALAAGLDAVLEQRTHKRVLVFRPIYRGRRTGSRVPARHRGREDGAVGRRGDRRARVDRRAAR